MYYKIYGRFSCGGNLAEVGAAYVVEIFQGKKEFLKIPLGSFNFMIDVLLGEFWVSEMAIAYAL